MPQSVAQTVKDTSGLRTVVYRDAKGITHNATVIGAGSSSGVKLRIAQGATQASGHRVIDNVALATSVKQTNVYFNRFG